jgi:hypothetical protein
VNVAPIDRASIDPLDRLRAAAKNLSTGVLFDDPADLAVTAIMAVELVTTAIVELEAERIGRAA